MHELSITEEILRITVEHAERADARRVTDMFAAGIIDPAKVTRSALENAASVAALLLTTRLKDPPVILSG